MTRHSLTATCGPLIAALILAGSATSQAQSSQSGNFNFTTDKILISVGAGVVAAVVIVLVVHKSHGTHTVTGCVNTRPDGAGILSDNDKQEYALTGDLAGIKPGERMTLQLKKLKPQSSSAAPLWENRKLVKDFGVCQP